MPDIDDVETELATMDGIENAWPGRVLMRLARAVRFTHGRTAILASRVQALEDRVAALENPPPPP